MTDNHSDWYEQIKNEVIFAEDLAKVSTKKQSVQDHLLGWRDAVGNHFDHLPPDQAMRVLGYGSALALILCIWALTQDNPYLGVILFFCAIWLGWGFFEHVTV